MLQTTVQQESKPINTILAELNGGWEIWLQITLALNMLGVTGGTATRSAKYPNNKISDFMVKPNDKGLPIWVELKTQYNTGDQTLVKRFQDDIQKISDLSGTFLRDNIVVALAYARPDNNTQANLIAKLASSSKISVWQFVSSNWQQWSLGGGEMALKAHTILFYNQSAH
jgi:hypothetical protein